MNIRNNYNATRIAAYVGYITQAIVINLTPLFFIIFQEKYHISLTELGNLILLTFVIQIAVDLLSIWFLPKIGFRAAAVTAHVTAVIGLCLLGLMPLLLPENAVYAGLLMAVFFYSVGGGLTEVIISPIIDALPSDAKASSMSLLHSFYSWGTFSVVLITTPLLLLFGKEHWYILPFLWAIVPLANIFLFCLVPIVEPTNEPTGESGEDGKNHSLWRGGLIYFFIAIMVCSGAAEQSVSQWASLFAEKAIGVSKSLGDLLGPCGFALTMSFGRMGYGLFGQKINIRKALMACSGLAIGCYALMIFSSNPIFALLGCAFCGLGTSLLWPGTLAVASATFTSGKATMFCVLAFAGDVGCSLGPWISGIVSDTVGGKAQQLLPFLTGDTEQVAMKIGMLASSFFPILLLVLLWIGSVKKVFKEDNK